MLAEWNKLKVKAEPCLCHHAYINLYYMQVVHMNVLFAGMLVSDKKKKTRCFSPSRYKFMIQWFFFRGHLKPNSV